MEEHYGSISARGNYIVCPSVFAQNELLLRSSCLFARACDVREFVRENVIFVSVGENLVGRFKFSFKKTHHGKFAPRASRTPACFDMLKTSISRAIADNYEYRIALRIAFRDYAHEEANVNVSLRIH